MSAHHVDAVDDRWPAALEVPSAVLDQLVLASNLLGSDRRLANFGGGNTSAKGVLVDHVGRSTRVMWVKGSGSDLATMGASAFTGLRLDEVEPLRERESMSDEEMVAHLSLCMIDPAMPRGSIETLLHAFIPAAHVHHTHPDAINVFAGSADGEELIAACFGETAAWIPYIRPGFTLAQQVGAAVRERPELRLVVLAKHGLVVWGDSAVQAYRTTIEVVNHAARFANERIDTGSTETTGSAAAERPLTAQTRRSLLREIAPAVRGAVSSERSKLLTIDSSPRVLEFISSPHAAAVTQIGAACPDHLIHIKRVPMWVPFDPDVDDAASLTERVRALAADYRDSYRRYVQEHADETTVPGDPDPRVVLIEQLGLVGVGVTPQASKLARDLYHRAVEVISGAQALGGFVSLTDAESFAIEYWPLELYKLSLAPAPRELQGRVALVTGVAGGIGRAVAERLAQAGACVVGLDLDWDGAQAVLADLGDRGLAVGGDVTNEDSVSAAFAAAAERFGGVDIVVSNAGIASSSPIEDTSLQEWERNHRILGTGYFLVAREAFRALRRQGTGGSIVFVASKNAIVAGRNASAYSSAKAAELHLARCLAEEGGDAGIRVNTVNPDAVLSGSRIWGPDSTWRAERAAAYGLAPDQLEEHYRLRTTLKLNVFPADIAEAVLHFASPARSGKSTGNILNVDGGVPAAFSR